MSRRDDLRDREKRDSQVSPRTSSRRSESTISLGASFVVFRRMIRTSALSAVRNTTTRVASNSPTVSTVLIFAPMATNVRAMSGEMPLKMTLAPIRRTASTVSGPRGTNSSVSSSPARTARSRRW